MKAFLATCSLFAALSTSASAISVGDLGISGVGSFGTKFVCCSIQNNSCVSGSSTTYTAILRDRALTQVDAQVRCGFSSMYWATHQCPSDTYCSSSSSGGSTGSSSATPSNRTSGEILSSLYKWSDAGQYCYMPDPFHIVDKILCGR